MESGLRDDRRGAGREVGLVCAQQWCIHYLSLTPISGRRTLFLISNTGMLVVFCAWTVTVALYHDGHIVAAGKATVPLIFIL
jgi:hypothetical protein